MDRKLLSNPLFPTYSLATPRQAVFLLSNFFFYYFRYSQYKVFRLH
jgi:hypothetical protein